MKIVNTLKTFTFLSLYALSFQTTFAQPNIDSTTLPLPNLQMTYYVDTVVSPAILVGSGANQTWNFSTVLQADFIDTTIYFHPDSTPFSSEPFAQAALYALQDLGIYTYLQRISSNSGPEAYDVTTGIAGNNPQIGSFSAPATDGDTLLMTPLTYNTTFFDDGQYEFSTTFLGVPVDVTITVTHYDTADGYGTLTLPNLTVSNVLRVSRRIKIITEATNSLFGQVSYQEDSLRAIYFIADISGFRFPVLTISHDLVSDTISARFINFNVVADFTASITSALVGQSINFTNLTQNADSYLWDFGDGNTSVDVDPVHVYSSSGQYTVKLVATNPVDADSVFKLVTVGVVNVELPEEEPVIRLEENRLVIQTINQADVEILTIDGKSLYKGKTGFVTLDISMLQTPMLFIKVNGKGFKIPVGALH